jgi:hypothetical protein
MTTRSLLGTLCLAAVATAVGAAERRPLPRFAVTSLEGTAVASESLPQEGAWLLIYAAPDCAPCDALIAKMDDDEHAEAASRIVVIVGADSSRARAVAGRFPDLQAARWLADPAHAGRDALRIQAQPTILGMRGESMEWRFAGVSRRPGEMESILSSWLKRR